MNDDKLTKLLRSRGLRVTQPRQVVIEFLLNQAEPVQVSQIISLQGNWADRASLYRTIKLFKSLGIINEVHRPGGDWLELGEDFSPHHHHLTCTQCGLSKTLSSPSLEQSLSNLASDAGFKPTGHHVEIVGVCDECLALAGRYQ